MIILKNIETSNKKLISNETKHFAPANKEWANSSYNYNKRLPKSIVVKDNMIKTLIENYFNMSNNKALARSRRMRNLIRKNTSNRIFVGKPEIKQTNDKCIVNIFTFNRERYILLRRLLYRNRWRKLLQFWKKNNKFIAKLKSPKIRKITKLINKFKLKRLLKRKRLYKLSLLRKRLRRNKFRFIRGMKKHRKFFKGMKTRRNLFKRKKLRLSSKFYSRLRAKNELNFLSLKVLTLNKKFSILYKLFYYLFLRYVLSLFDVKVFFKDQLKSRKRSRSIRRQIPWFSKIRDITQKNYIFIAVKNKVYCIDLLNIFNKSNKTINDKLDYNLTNLNYILSQLLEHVFIKSGILNRERKLHHLYRKFNKQYFTKFVYKYVKKNITFMHNFNKLMVNKFKFNELLPGLKMLIGKIYNKNIELNITSLRYPHLNTDIFTKMMASKVRKRKRSPWQKVKFALKFIKLPYAYLPDLSKFNLNNIRRLNRFNSPKLDNIESSMDLFKETKKDYLQNILSNLYPRVLINEQKYKKEVLKEKKKKPSYKLTSILSRIRYKWVAGAKFEIAGRLTRRYTASKSISKTFRLGSLKNYGYGREIYKKENPSMVLLRNQEKSNSEYAFNKSKRRIGSFGLKGWISSY